MRRFEEKNSGAYRTAGGISEIGISYGMCQICGGAYQLSKVRTGLGSYSLPHNYEEIRAREKAASDIAERIFTDPKNRCVCDPDSDIAEEPRARAPKSGLNPSSPRDLLELIVGDRVRHAVFGPGTVQEINGTGQTAEILVLFDSRGAKHLSLAWAPLEKIPNKKNNSATAKPTSLSNQIPGSGKSITTELNQLWELFSAGALTSEQFEAAKNLLLGKTD